MRVVRSIALMALVWVVVEAACPRSRCQSAFGPRRYTVEGFCGKYGLEVDDRLHFMLMQHYGRKPTWIDYIPDPYDCKLYLGPFRVLRFDRALYLVLGFAAVVAFEIICRTKRAA
jgi:hypothetical protein